MATDSPVTLEINDLIATITIQREASLNALNGEILEGLSKHLSELREISSGKQAYERCRVVIIRGAGEKAFVAGADIKFMQTAQIEQLKYFIGLGQRVMREIETMPLPIIAAVQGFAIGGGLELALAADLIVASERAKLGQAEVNLGLIPGFGGTQRLAARVGSGSTRRIVFAGEALSAEEAFRLGIVDYLVAPNKLGEKVAEVARLLLTKSPLAIAAAKRSILAFYNGQLQEGLAQEIDEFLALSQSADAKEGMSAFIEKRIAIFPGK